MGIVRLRDGKSTDFHEATQTGDAEAGLFARFQRADPYQNSARSDTWKHHSDCTDERHPGVRKSQAAGSS